MTDRVICQAGYLREVIWDPSRRREKKAEGVVGDYYCITEVKVTHSCEGDAYGCLTVCCVYNRCSLAW